MFILTVLIYPGVLALLCVGAGLLVDWIGGGRLPGPLLLVAGLAATIAISQIAVWIAPIAPATPWLLLAAAAAGLVLGRGRAAELAHALRTRRQARAQVALSVLAYLIAIAPVLLAGRPSLSSYMTLTDSATHILGAGYLLAHGYSFGHLDMRNSVGLVVRSYYDTAYPSGADTLFGGSALLLRLPLMWTFQPFNAFLLATAVGPAWLMAAGVGLRRWWAAIAALTATVPALVYGYELIASVKEVATVSLLLSLGALVLTRERWLTDRARSAIPYCVILAADVSAIGVGFGPWALLSTLVLLAAIAFDRSAGGARARRALPGQALLGAVAIVVCAWPTWIHLPGSVAVATSIATTHNPGNLQAPLQLIQVLGAWLSGSYLIAPAGSDLAVTHLLGLITVLAGTIGVVHLVLGRRWEALGWLCSIVALLLALGAYGTRWVDAKGLVLTQSAIVLLAWAGVAALLSLADGSRAKALARMLSGDLARGGVFALALLLAVVLSAGIAASDAMQYRASQLAPTGRYEEMASIGSRFAGRGPALFTDFDEYSLYVLRSLDVGGPSFLFPPPEARGATVARGHGVNLESIRPEVMRSYPLIVTRVNPAAARPPSAYALLWHGRWYEVWGRRKRAPVPLLALSLEGRRVRCRRLASVAALARRAHATLAFDTAGHVQSINLVRGHRPGSWYLSGPEVVMNGPGSVTRSFLVKRTGTRELWLRGEMMPTTYLSIDGRRVKTVSGAVSGNGDSPDTIGPIMVRLTAGRHVLRVRRSGFSLAPGNAAHAYVDRAFLSPLGVMGGQQMRQIPASRWRTLCGRRLRWVEVVPSEAAPSSGGPGR